MSEPAADMCALIEHVAKALVADPAVLVESFDEERETVIELTVSEADTGRVIGRQGRTARALRHLLSAASLKTNKRFALEILE